MLVYSIIMFLVATVFMAVSIAIYRGKTDLIHDYHRRKVTDKTAYGKPFGKALSVIAITLLLSGIVGLLDDLAMLSVAILVIGLCVGVGCIVAVQRKYNKGFF